MDPRDQTFITIHNLTPECNILFASDSLLDILGYQPEEVQGKSCFDYFHPDEVPFARSVHSRGVLLDKAAVLHYCRVLARDGRWMNCECCFTIVHDVLVACTSIYLGAPRNERRAFEAPQIRRIFSSSPRDPRYHMLEHLSPKFKMPPMEREPRAALILNRFTRNLTIMFATSAIESIIGLTPGELKDKPFYDYIAPECQQQAEDCLESAKANESIAYLRFWFNDPREPDDAEEEEEEEEGEEEEEEEEEGEIPDDRTDAKRNRGAVRDKMRRKEGELAARSSKNNSDTSKALPDEDRMDIDEELEVRIKIENDDGMNDVLPGIPASTHQPRRLGGGASKPSALSLADRRANQTHQVGHHSRRSSPSRTTPAGARSRRRQREPFELEAVVSCTSDGLVVVLRKARPPLPPPQPPLLNLFDYRNGLFAAPWGMWTVEPYVPPELIYTFRPPLLPEYMPLRPAVQAAGGPPRDLLMRSIQQAAVFAWGLTGINGKYALYGRGVPRVGSVPPDGLPIWDPNAAPTEYVGPENSPARRWTQTEQIDYDKDVASSSSQSSHQSQPRKRPCSPDGSIERHNRVSQPPWNSDANYSCTSYHQSPSTWSRFSAASSTPETFGAPHGESHARTNFTPNHIPRPASPLPTPMPVPHNLPPEPWAEASRGRPCGSTYTISTTPTSSSGESSRDIRSMWE